LSRMNLLRMGNGSKGEKKRKGLNDEETLKGLKRCTELTVCSTSGTGGTIEPDSEKKK